MNTPLDPARVLLVEDDPAQARLYRRILERAFADLRLNVFEDSASAAEYLESHFVDVLITDLQMPGIDGLELLRRVKQRSPHAQVLILTAASTAEKLVEAASLGASDYLLKPFENGDLINFVEQAQRRLERWRAALAGTLHRRRSLLSSH